MTTMNATLHRTAHNRAKTPRTGAFAQLDKSTITPDFFQSDFF